MSPKGFFNQPAKLAPILNGDGFTPISEFRPARRLMLAIDGLPDTGKTEFALTAPPGIGLLAVDRGYEHVITKSDPPSTRQGDISIKTFQMPQPGENPRPLGTVVTGDIRPIYKEIWDDFNNFYRKAIASPRFKTVIVDGDSDVWELQQLAAFGKVVQIPPLQRTDVNYQRKIFIGRGFDSGKNIIFTYRVKPEYEKTIKMNASGQPIEVDEKTGEYKRAGWSDQDYLVQVQLRALYDASRITEGGSISNGFGIRITKCKPDPELVGFELWGAEATFSGLVSCVYPNVPLQEWGL